MVDAERTSEGGEPPRGSGLLARISNAMVQAQKEYFGRGPDRAKSYMLDDFLIIVMRGGITRAEQTMVDADQEDLVRNFRQQFENEMATKLRTMIEELTNRTVVNYQSQIMFEPDVIIEIFMFDRGFGEDEVSATAEDQLADRGIGDATGEADSER